MDRPAREGEKVVGRWDLGIWMHAHESMAGLCSLMTDFLKPKDDLINDLAKERHKVMEYL